MVVGILESRCAGQDRAARLLKGVLELGSMGGRVSVCENRSDSWRCNLDDHPLVLIRRPDADAITARNTDREQRARAALDLGTELVVRQANALLTRDERLAITVSCHDPRPQLPDRLTAERLSARSGPI